MSNPRLEISYQACLRFGEGTETFNRVLISSSPGDIRVISYIAEWYSVWQEVTQVQQGLTLLVLGWVTGPPADA